MRPRTQAPPGSDFKLPGMGSRCYWHGLWSHLGTGAVPRPPVQHSPSASAGTTLSAISGQQVGSMQAAAERAGGRGSLSSSQPLHTRRPLQRRPPRHPVAGQPWASSSSSAAGGYGSLGSSSSSGTQRQVRLRRGPALARGGKSAVPDVPVPGDDQGSTIYTLLARESGNYDAVPFELPSADNGAASSSSEQQQQGDAPPPEQQPEQGGIPHRWQVVGMMALSFVLCNMDKVNMSVAVIPMAKELGWSATERGLVSSAFFWGYSLTQIPAGWISTSIGGARVLLAGVALWSLGTLVAPPAAHMGLFALCATRLFVGLGEGLAPSSATNVMARLVPERERARAVTTVFGGLDVGSAVGLLLCGPLINWLGWQSVFYVFAVLGLFWCLAWPFCDPERQDRDLPPHMLQRPPAGAPSAAKPALDVPWGEFLRSPPVWAVIVAHFCYNWGYYTLLAWLPSYMDMALGLDVGKSSLLTLIPYIAMTLMTPLVGPVADGLVSRGWSMTSVRKLSQGIAFAGPAACMLALAALTPTAPGGGPTTLIVAILSLAFALGAWARAGLYCNHQDLSPKYAAVLLGLTNTAGAIPGVLGVTAAGYLLDMTGSFAYALFYPTAACQLFGLVIYSIFASSKRIWD